MSIAAWRVILWVLGILFLTMVVMTGHASFEKAGLLNWEFLAFVLSVMALDQSIRLDERLKMKS